MTDIVERLRNTLTGSDGARQTLNEAADEIDRLRAVEDEFQRWRTSEANEVAQWFERATDAEYRLAEAVEVVREFHDAAQIDAVMEGPRLTGWNRSALNRAWPKATAFLAKLEVKP